MSENTGVNFSGCVGKMSLHRNFDHYSLSGYFYCECEEEVWVYSASSGKAIECKACGRKYNISEPTYEYVLGDR